MTKGTVVGSYLQIYGVSITIRIVVSHYFSSPYPSKIKRVTSRTFLSQDCGFLKSSTMFCAGSSLLKL